MGADSPERICYEFFCARFPRCLRARGRGCAAREPEYALPDGTSSQVRPGECTTENEYPLFLPNPNARTFIHR